MCPSLCLCLCDGHSLTAARRDSQLPLPPQVATSQGSPADALPLFEVQLAEGGPRLSSVEALVAALGARAARALWFCFVCGRAALALAAAGAQVHSQTLQHARTRTRHAAAGGHEVATSLVSNVTSFGMGFSVHDGAGGWQHIPIAYPLRTGLWAVRARHARARAC